MYCATVHDGVWNKYPRVHCFGYFCTMGMTNDVLNSWAIFVKGKKNPLPAGTLYTGDAVFIHHNVKGKMGPE